jgi:hypothetical protein
VSKKFKNALPLEFTGLPSEIDAGARLTW